MTYSFRYDPEKNLKLLLERGVDFDDIIESIYSGGLLDIQDHPSDCYPHQKVFIVYWEGYYYNIPCVPEGEMSFFMKTIIPSRKLKKIYNNHP